MNDVTMMDRNDTYTMLEQIGERCSKPYRRHVCVTFYDDDKIRTVHAVSPWGFKTSYVGFGLKSYMNNPNDCTKDEFVWTAHKLIHEFGHVNQRMNLFKKNDEDSILMAKQQAICRAFPGYDKSSYYGQLVEIDAERYAWQKTVELLPNMYPDLFTEDEVKQGLVNGLHKYQGVWFADKNFNTWEDGVEKLNDEFEQAKEKTWDIHSGHLDEDDNDSFAEKFESNHRLYEKYLHTFGSERNDLLFRYCVENDGVDTVKFSCLRNEVKVIKREMRKLPDLSNLKWGKENSMDKDDKSL